MHIYTKKTGFTLIELLVVIAIIAILSVVVMGSLTNMRDRGQAAKIVGDVRVIKDAVLFRYSTETRYPTETQLDLQYPALASQIKTIQNMISAGVFNGKFAQAPAIQFASGGQYIYDADAGDSGAYDQSDCGSYLNNDYGANIVILNMIANAPDVVTELDALVDDSDGLDCGVVRRATAGDNSILYNISPLPVMFP